MAGNISPTFSGFVWNKIESYEKESHLLKLKDACIAATSDDAIQLYASNLNDGLACRLSPELTMGGLHLIRLLQFENGTRWLARIQLEASTEESARRMQSEIDTMTFLREHSKIPVPEVYGYQLYHDTSVGRAFMIMECLPGNAAMDLDGGYKSHYGEIPSRRKPEFFRAVATVQAQMVSLRLPKIGTIVRRDDGSYDMGAIPGLGGPFDSATAFFEAWAAQAAFPTSESEIRSQTRGFADQIFSAISTFPSQVNLLAKVLSTSNLGPFPIHHPDLYHSNIIVDDEYNLLGVIDWEGAHTVPWELVELPLFLSVIPPPMDAPWNYDNNGEPKDPGTKQRWQDRARYIELVEEAEGICAFDGKLSSTLRDHALQHLAFAIREYPQGKVGFYDKVLLQFNRYSQIGQDVG